MSADPAADNRRGPDNKPPHGRAPVSRMTPPPRALRRALPLAVLAPLLLLALAGCTGGSDDEGDVLQAAKDAAASGDLVLYLNLTIDGQTYRYSTSDPTTPPALVPPPSPPPLMVNGTLEASGLPDGSQAELSWSIAWGDRGGAAAAGGDSSSGGGNASANATAPGGSTPGNGSSLPDDAPSAPDVNGTDLPARAQHSYLREGTHRLQAALAVAGEEIQAIQVPIVVASNESQVPPGTVLGNESFAAEGDLPFALGACPADGAGDFPWTFNATVNGTPANVSRVMLVLTTSGVPSSPGLQLLDGNATVVAEAEGDGAENALDAVGPFPPGDYTVRVLGCSTLGASYEVEGAATYVAATASKP